MLYWSLVLLVVAIVAGVMGFGGVSSSGALLARAVAVIALLVAAASLVAGAGWAR